ncbi:hypothetical protein J7M22_09790 [Candidatus Poribacteria bacterium]|nr:hypothetical protein [Candidatus Poribacteria bacterium]
MTPRERVLTALAHEQPNQVPKTAGFTPHLYKVFRERTGASDPYEYFKIEIRGVGFKRPKRIPDFSVYFDEPPLPNASVNEYVMARRYAEAGVDMLLTGDDVGMQDRLMMSPQMRRRWLKPRLAKVIQAGKEINPKVHIYYHSDGNIEDIIPDLIEVGVDILNPVQPECMDPVKLKRLYGDKLTFWGTIGTQTTMPFGTPEEVKRVVHERVRTVGKGGGLVLAPTHVLEPDVPGENVIAFFEAVEETRRYYRK